MLSEAKHQLFAAENNMRSRDYEQTLAEYVNSWLTE